MKDMASVYIPKVVSFRKKIKYSVRENVGNNIHDVSVSVLKMCRGEIWNLEKDWWKIEDVTPESIMREGAEHNLDRIWYG